MKLQSEANRIIVRCRQTVHQYTMRQQHYNIGQISELKIAYQLSDHEKEMSI